MDVSKLMESVDAYVEAHWDDCLADISRLVEIPSFEERDKATADAPFGPGPRAALDEALAIAERMGLETADVDGYAGYAELPGSSAAQIGIIGHVDVVPAGSGWAFPPYQVSVKDGYLIGRGVLDDKGPSMVALHALKFWKDQGHTLPYTVRFIFGCNEETDLLDVEHYREKLPDPAFLFTPDAEFPLGYGEKGGYNGLLSSKRIEGGRIRSFSGGDATNAVPGVAQVVIEADPSELPAADRLVITDEGDGLVRIDAQGKSAHASLPDTGINAIGLIVDYLLANDLVTADERAFLELDQRLLAHTDGSGVGIAASDDDFGALTVVGGTISFEDGVFAQTFDARYPTSIDAPTITAAMRALAEPIGATVENTMDLPPFLMDPDSPQIAALMRAFEEVTGEDRKPFTMGGGTYAREFTTGVSFGVEMPWVDDPDWVGSMHGVDEGIRIEQLKTAWKVYVLAIGLLCETELPAQVG